MLYVKTALLLLLAFTSIAIATTTIAIPPTSSNTRFYVFKLTGTIGDYLAGPLGDPIDDDSAFPH